MRLPKYRALTHPGELLLQEFLILRKTQKEAAERLGIS